jgi:hypothetical protein
MEEQIPSSNFPPDQQGLGGQITPEQLEQLKARATGGRNHADVSATTNPGRSPCRTTSASCVCQEATDRCRDPPASPGIVWNCIWCATGFQLCREHLVTHRDQNEIRLSEGRL